MLAQLSLSGVFQPRRPLNAAAAWLTCDWPGFAILGTAPPAGLHDLDILKRIDRLKYPISAQKEIGFIIRLAIHCDCAWRDQTIVSDAKPARAPLLEERSMGWIVEEALPGDCRHNGFGFF